MAVINTGISANRFKADAVAKQNGGRLPKHAELDKFKMEGNSGAFWAREWAAKGVLIEKGKDLVDKKTGVLIPYSDIEKANKIRIESGKSAIVGVNGVFFLIDPEAFTIKNGLYVPENPKITVVENAVRIMICACSSTTAISRFHMICRWIAAMADAVISVPPWSARYSRSRSPRRSSRGPPGWRSRPRR